MLRKSPFFDFLNRHNQRSFDNYVAASTEDEHFIDWNGFVLPNDYGDPEPEYFGIRNSCGLCDVSPMQKIRIRGNEAGAFLDRLLTRPVSAMPVLQATYTVFCTEQGHMKDDAMLYKLATDDYLLLPSDVDHKPYFESVCERYDLSQVSFETDVDAFAGLAFQGPAAAAVLSQMGYENAPSFRPMEIREIAIGATRGLLARMGFTADLGYELWVPPSEIDTVIDRVRSVQSEALSLPGYGLTAIQTCRLEGGFIVAGWDCASEIEPSPGFERSPYELGLSWLVKLDGDDFVGRDALRRQRENGAPFSLRYFSTPSEQPIADAEPVYASVDGSNTKIGFVTSSAWSWGLEQGIGNASIQSAYAAVELAWVDSGTQRQMLSLRKKPLMNLPRRTQVPASIEF